MGGGRFWSYFRGKNRPIYMALCSFLVLGGPLDTGSRPSVVNDWYWFPAKCSVFQIVAFFVNLLYIYQCYMYFFASSCICNISLTCEKILCLLSEPEAYHNKHLEYKWYSFKFCFRYISQSISPTDILTA